MHLGGERSALMDRQEGAVSSRGVNRVAKEETTPWATFNVCAHLGWLESAGAVTRLCEQAGPRHLSGSYQVIQV